MLEVCGLTKRYGNTCAIEDITFSAGDGQIIGLIGHNGSGKTTTMNIIVGYIAPTSGSVRIDGIDIAEEPRRARSLIGYLPETPALYPELTVEEQLSFAAELRGIRDKRDAIKRACAKADVEAVRGRLIRNLSKGYRQRVGLAQAFLGDPPLVVLDEPSNGLDPQQIAEMRSIIRGEGKTHTILLSSHALGEVEQLCDSLVILSSGKLSACGTISELKERFCGVDEYELRVKGACDDAAVRRAVEAAGGQVTVFREASPSLETVFFQLTNDERYHRGAEK